MATKKPLIYYDDNGHVEFHFQEDGGVKIDAQGRLCLTPEQTRDLGVILDVHARNQMIKAG